MTQEQPASDDAEAEADQQSRPLPEAEVVYRNPNDPSLQKGDGPVLRMLGFVLLAVAAAVIWWRGDSSDIRFTADQLAPVTIDEAVEWELVTAITVPDGSETPAAVYSLDGEIPEGCRIDPKTGLITWTPAEDQGPGQYQFTVVTRVAEVEVPNERLVEVTVREVNRPPILSEVTPQKVKVAEKLSVALSANDPDEAGGELRFELVGKQLPGISLSSKTGLLTWTPPKGTPAGPHSVTVQVTDGGEPPRMARTTFEIRVDVPVTVAKPVVPLRNHHVFLVGVSGYRPRVGLSSLRFPERDVEELAKVFEKKGVPARNIIVMSASRAAKEYRFMPIAKHIRQELVRWLKFRKAGDRLILAFSGHGIQLGKVPYFCPADIDLRKRDTMLSFATIYELLKLCPAEVKLLLTDACRTNPFSPKTRDIVPGLESVTRPQAIPPPGGIAAMFACAAGQEAFEDKGLGQGKAPGHGVFFHFLIQAFQGDGDADKDGRITVTELHAYVAGKVEEYVSKKFGEKQTPTLKASLVGTSTILGAGGASAKDAPPSK